MLIFINIKNQNGCQNDTFVKWQVLRLQSAANIRCDVWGKRWKNMCNLNEKKYIKSQRMI